MHNLNLIAYLRSITPLSAEVEACLNSIVQARRLRRKEYLLKMGHACRHVYFIRSGFVRRFHFNDDDREITSGLLMENQVVYSVSSFCEQVPSTEYIQAIEPTELLFISYDELLGLMEQFPELVVICRKIAIRCHQLTEEHNQLLLSGNALDRLKYMQKNHADILRRVPHKVLASYLGCTPENLSRVKGLR
ncbi:MAG TPA: Crp/Fnr family transcriptional regulator [Mucilaginibacter sp.]|jgi:CRP-like cAMP-binding protein